MSRKRFFGAVLVFLAVCVLAGQSSANAQCNGGYWGWLVGCGGEWEVENSGTPAVDFRPFGPGVENAIAGCESPNETPPTGVKCILMSTTQSVREWRTSGSLNAGICLAAGIPPFDIGGQIGGSISSTVGEMITVTHQSYASSELTSFCQTCTAQHGVNVERTSYDIKCSCSSGGERSGTVTRCVGPYIKASTGHTPNPPCNPICPPGA
jgi:hypothetical protein